MRLSGVWFTDISNFTAVCWKHRGWDWKPIREKAKPLFLGVGAHSLRSMGAIWQAKRGEFIVYSVGWLARTNSHSTRAPANSVWSMHYKIEWMVLGGWVMQPKPFVYTSHAEIQLLLMRRETSIIFIMVFRSHASSLEWRSCWRPIPSSEARTTIYRLQIRTFTNWAILALASFLWLQQASGLGVSVNRTVRALRARVQQ